MDSLIFYFGEEKTFLLTSRIPSNASFRAPAKHCQLVSEFFFVRSSVFFSFPAYIPPCENEGRLPINS